MMDISTPKILTNVQKNSRAPDTNFPGNEKFKNPKFPVPTSREETLVAKKQIITVVVGFFYF